VISLQSSSRNNPYVDCRYGIAKLAIKRSGKKRSIDKGVVADVLQQRREEKGDVQSWAHLASRFSHFIFHQLI
jgi:hypothetical protein